ncbi:MAG: helix-turn-helix transcriptional regulator, partial [Polaromonas sp.]
MHHLTRNDFACALQLLARVEAQADDVRSFAYAVLRALGEFVACELMTLCVCDLNTGQRQEVGLPDVQTGADEMDGLKRHFFEPPQLRCPGPEGDFQPRAADGGYCQRIGLKYAIAVTLFRDRRTLVSVVLERRCLDFDERDRERLALLRPHLAFLYQHACKAAVPKDDTLLPCMPMPIRPPGLTQREAEVMDWLACGKTDAEIAALLSISPRTVQKHLEHIYVKLGVETRTAAVMRALAICDRESLRKSVD